MAWNEKVILEWQIKNEMTLKDVNETLKSPVGSKTGKVGIFAPGQMGDLMTCMSVLKYMDVLWHDKDIIWYCNFPNADCLKFSPISEVRMYPWAGNGLSAGTPDFYPLLCNENNRLNKKLASQYELTKDLEDGYFPTPWMLSPEKRHNFEYPNVSRKVFGIDQSLEWHPYLNWSEQERIDVLEFVDKMPKRKTIMFETFGGSYQSPIENGMILKTIQLCKDKLGNCNFIFASHKYLRNSEEFPVGFFDSECIYSASKFTPRQCALLIDYCDLMICISSGISVSTSCWGSKPVPKIQFCGSRICSTMALATGEFHLVETDRDAFDVVEAKFFNKLTKLLTEV